jgi:protein-tyrosine phosphatase
VLLTYIDLSSAGVSRSVAILIAYLMVTEQLSYEKAYQDIRNKHPLAW